MRTLFRSAFVGASWRLPGVMGCRFQALQQGCLPQWGVVCKQKHVCCRRNIYTTHVLCENVKGQAILRAATTSKFLGRTHVL